MGWEGLRGGEVEGEGVGPTFSSVYATPLLQRQAQLGLNSALVACRRASIVRSIGATSGEWVVNRDSSVPTSWCVSFSCTRMSATIAGLRTSAADAVTLKSDWSRLGVDILAEFLCPRRGEGVLSDAAVRPSVCLSHLGQLGAQRLGQATRAVRTADPSAHGRRSAGAYRLAAR